jgi:hypothetical protein
MMGRSAEGGMKGGGSDMKSASMSTSGVCVCMLGGRDEDIMRGSKLGRASIACISESLALGRLNKTEVLFDVLVFTFNVEMDIGSGKYMGKSRNVGRRKG